MVTMQISSPRLAVVVQFAIQVVKQRLGMHFTTKYGTENQPIDIDKHPILYIRGGAGGDLHWFVNIKFQMYFQKVIMHL
jgi:hypothetical protein